MQFDLVSPERLLASTQATAVSIPGAEGDMTIMDDHAPLITTLRPGIVKVDGSGAEQSFVVTGGFAEIGPGGVSVLAELAVPAAEAKASMIDGLLDSARQAAGAAEGAAKDSADKQISDLEALKAAVAG